MYLLVPIARGMNFTLRTCFLTIALAFSCTQAAENGPVRIIWAKHGTPLFVAFGYDAVVDGAGNAFISLYNRSSLPYLLKMAASDGSTQWKYRLGYNGGRGGKSVALDRDGNAFAFVYLREAGNVIARFSPRGEITWRRNPPARFTGLAVDSSGDVIAIGRRIIKYSGLNGTIIWQHPQPAGVLFSAIKIDSDGDIILGGVGPGIHTMKCAGKDGTCIWERDFNHLPLRPGGVYVNPLKDVLGLDIDGQGNVAVMGYLPVSSTDDLRPYVLRYAGTDGSILWKRDPDQLPYRCLSLATDSVGNVFASADSFSAIKYAAQDGAQLWSRDSLGVGSAIDLLAVDANDDIIIGGILNPGSPRFAKNEYFIAKCAGSDGSIIWQEHRPPARAGQIATPYALGVGPGFVVATGMTGHDIGTIKYAEGPTPQTLQAEPIEGANVRLHAEVNPNLFETRAAFIYGTDPALHEGTTTDFVAIGRGRKAVGIEATATFLQPGATYYYCAIGIASAGLTTRGEIRSFKAPQPDP